MVVWWAKIHRAQGRGSEPVLRKFWAPGRARGASGATGYQSYRGGRLALLETEGRKDGEAYLLDFEGAKVSGSAALGGLLARTGHDPAVREYGLCGQERQDSLLRQRVARR